MSSLLVRPRIAAVRYVAPVTIVIAAKLAGQALADDAGYPAGPSAHNKSSATGGKTC